MSEVEKPNGRTRTTNEAWPVRPGPQGQEDKG